MLQKSDEKFVESNGRAHTAMRDPARVRFAAIPASQGAALRWNAPPHGSLPYEDRTVARRSWFSFSTILAILVFTAGCVEIPRQPGRTVSRPVAYQGVVFVADGA